VIPSLKRSRRSTWNPSARTCSRGRRRKCSPPQRDGDQFQGPLDDTDRPGRAGDVVGQQQAPAGAQHPVHLGHRPALVGDRAQRERADHGVERGTRKRQFAGVGLAQVHGAAQLAGSVAGELEHGRAQINPGQPDLAGVEGQVQAGADGHLQGVPGSLRADPGPAVREQDPVEEPHGLVIGRRLVVPVAAPPVTARLVGGHYASSFLRGTRRSPGPGREPQCPAAGRRRRWPAAGPVMSPLATPAVCVIMSERPSVLAAVPPHSGDRSPCSGGPRHLARDPRLRHPGGWRERITIADDEVGRLAGLKAAGAGCRQ
jgi:hypothetical protein